MNDAGTATARLGMALTSVVRLADVARQDSVRHQVGELYRDDPAFDIPPRGRAGRGRVSATTGPPL